jgi:hypothetical protein
MHYIPISEKAMTAKSDEYQEDFSFRNRQQIAKLSGKINGIQFEKATVEAAAPSERHCAK